MKTSHCHIYLFQQDLRLSSHKALHALAQQDIPVLLVYMRPPYLKGSNQEQIVAQHINQLNEKLVAHQTAIQIVDYNDLDHWQSIVDTYAPSQIHFTHTYNAFCISENETLNHWLSSHLIPVEGHHFHTIIPPYHVTKPDGTSYAKFTAFKNQWLKVVPALSPSATQLPEFVRTPMGETWHVEGNIVLPEINLNLDHYAEQRDIPSINGTSNLSTWLAIGALGHEQAYHLLLPFEKSLTELIWREFFIHVMYFNPHSKNQNFKSKYNGIEWRNNEQDFEAWCEGKTGYPMVDAGMRQLNQTGLMHNRVRMITASFLCKHLLTEWQWGEAYFASKLIDYDPAINVGNWQWVAGTGCDSAPYFRVFNPTAQQQKFDAKGKYIAQWVSDIQELTYPTPMVDHKKARQRALDVYKAGINPA